MEAAVVALPIRFVLLDARLRKEQAVFTGRSRVVRGRFGSLWVEKRFATVIPPPAVRSGREDGRTMTTLRTRESQQRFTTTPRPGSSIQPSCNTSARRIRLKDARLLRESSVSFRRRDLQTRRRAILCSPCSGEDDRDPLPFQRGTDRMHTPPSTERVQGNAGRGRALPAPKSACAGGCLAPVPSACMMLCHYPESTAENGGTASLGRGTKSSAGIYQWKSASRDNYGIAMPEPHTACSNLRQSGDHRIPPVGP